MISWKDLLKVLAWESLVHILKTDHGEEHAKLWVHVHCISISEDKGFAAFLFAGENYCNLLGCDWQNREFNAVELIKTAPSTRLSQTWKAETVLIRGGWNEHQQIHYAKLSLYDILYLFNDSFFLVMLVLKGYDN